LLSGVIRKTLNSSGILVNHGGLRRPGAIKAGDGELASFNADQENRVTYSPGGEFFEFLFDFVVRFDGERFGVGFAGEVDLLEFEVDIAEMVEEGGVWFFGVSDGFLHPGESFLGAF
jgi:hypothetical protein